MICWIATGVCFSEKFDELLYYHYKARVNELDRGADRLDKLSLSDLNQAAQMLTF